MCRPIPSHGNMKTEVSTPWIYNIKLLIYKHAWMHMHMNV